MWKFSKSCFNLFRTMFFFTLLQCLWLFCLSTKKMKLDLFQQKIRSSPKTSLCLAAWSIVRARSWYFCHLFFFGDPGPVFHLWWEGMACYVRNSRRLYCHCWWHVQKSGDQQLTSWGRLVVEIPVTLQGFSTMPGIFTTFPSTGDCRISAINSIKVLAIKQLCHQSVVKYSCSSENFLYLKAKTTHHRMSWLHWLSLKNQQKPWIPKWSMKHHR